MKRSDYPGLLALILANMIAIAVIISPTSVYSQNPAWMVYNTDNSDLPGNRVVAVAIDPEGNVWTGHSSGAFEPGDGCAKFNGKTWTVYNTDNSGLLSNNVNALAFDSNGNVWIGTGSSGGCGRGLAKFDGKTWTVYNKANSGLPSDNISSLKFDAQENLWVGSLDRGLAKFDVQRSRHMA